MIIRERVIQACRVRMLRRQPIEHIESDNAGGFGDPAHQVAVAQGASKGMSSAMVVQKRPLAVAFARREPIS
ncbi:hypothetical protein D3C87_1643990 [compost metagenome]